MDTHCIYNMSTGIMKTRVQKWGNSLALRVPKPLAMQVGIGFNSQVDLSLRGKELVIAPVSPPSLTLENLLSQVNENNLHKEVNTGPMTGGEAW